MKKEFKIILDEADNILDWQWKELEKLIKKGKDKILVFGTKKRKLGFHWEND